MLDALPGTLLFLLMMAGLFIPLEAFFGARTRRPTGQLLGASLLVFNTMLMQWFGVPVLEALSALTQVKETRSVAVFALVFVLSDLVGYFIHRAMHRVPFLWRFHKLHHEATELSWLDAWRQHPVDFILHGLAVGVPGALLGASLSQLASVVVLRKAFTTFLHANLRLSFGLVLASPSFHAVHHSADPRQYDSNFAGTFPLWDRLFGSLAADGRGGHHQPVEPDIEARVLRPEALEPQAPAGAIVNG